MDKVTETVGQTIIDNTLRWYQSGIGDDGVLFELDGKGLPPQWIRHKLIQKEGEWEVVVDSSGDKVNIIRALREVLQIDMASAAKLLKNLPGVVYTGTKTEANWIQIELKKKAAL